MKLGVSITVLSLSVLALTFQNCAKTNFTGAEHGAYLKAEADVLPSETTGTDPTVVSGDALPSATPSLTDITPPKNPNDPEPPGNLGKNSQNASSSNLVECELGSPNLKIKLSLTLNAQHSNDQATRVCMSENACLNIINEYAASHSDSMAMGAETSPGSTNQSTHVFPGSKGTCKNAQVLSDDQIVAILAEMAK
jgi:hypothetical protein